MNYLIKSCCTVMALLSPIAYVNAQGLDSQQEQSMQKLVCSSLGGSDITSKGELSLGDDVTAAVVCQLPPRLADSNDSSPSPSPSSDTGAQAFPFSPVTAVVNPPSGTVVTTENERSIATSCSADLHIPTLSNLYPAVSEGTSTVRCTGFNTPTNSSAGCSVNWSGPTSVTLGAEPYGGSVVVNFICTAYRSGIPTYMTYEYRDRSYPRLSYSAYNVEGYLNVVW